MRSRARSFLPSLGAPLPVLPRLPALPRLPVLPLLPALPVLAVLPRLPVLPPLPVLPLLPSLGPLPPLRPIAPLQERMILWGAEAEETMQQPTLPDEAGPRSYRDVGTRAGRRW